MVTANTPDQELPLSTPLACWHESLHAARHDAIVALSTRRARIASERPVPAGTPVFIELGPDAGIDAVAVDADADTFLVEFITVDDNAASVLGAARRAVEAPLPTSPVGVPRVRTDELLLAAPAGVAMVVAAAAPVPIAAPPVDPVVATTDGPSERTGEFLTSGLIEAPAEGPVAAVAGGDDGSIRTGEFFVSSFIDAPAQDSTAATASGDDAIIRTGEFLAVDPAMTAPASVDAALPTDAFAKEPAGTTDNDGASPGWRSADDDDAPDASVPAGVAAAVGAASASASSGPAWARALDTDLGDEPEGSEVDHTQRWPTARLASSEPDAAATPTPPAAVEETERWPAARVAVQAPVDPASIAAPAAARPATPPADVTTTATTSTPAVVAAIPTGGDEETTRWPAARAVLVSPSTTPSTTPVPTTPAVAPTPPTPPTPPTAAPAMSLDEGEDVVLEFTAPQRPAAGQPRPLPPPEPDGVVEVDFSEFKDVLGVATFRADGAAPRPLIANRVITPAPISISLPRTPSSSLQPVMEARNPFAGDSGVGPRPDSTPPVVPSTVGAGGDGPEPVAEQWVASSPSLPAPRLLDRGLDRVLRSGGGPNSATPKPLPFHDSTPSAPPLPVPTTPAPIPVPATTAAPIATTTPPGEPLTPRVVPAARSPFAVPPVSPVVAPRPPAVVPVVVPPRPMVPVSMPPRPVAVIPMTPLTVTGQPTATPAAVLAPTAPQPVPPGVPAAKTPTAPFHRPSADERTEHSHPVGVRIHGSASVAPVTPSAEGLPVIVGDGDGDET